MEKELGVMGQWERTGAAERLDEGGDAAMQVGARGVHGVPPLAAQVAGRRDRVAAMLV